MDKEFVLRFKAQVVSPLFSSISEKLSRVPPPSDPTTCMDLVKQLYEIDRGNYFKFYVSFYFYYFYYYF